MKIFYLSLSCLLYVGLVPTMAEGTKEVMPNSSNGTGLIVSTSTSFPLGNVGSYVPATGTTPQDQRIYFRIKDHTKESLYYGFNWETLSPNTPIGTYSDVYMNIYDPSGTLVSTVHLPASGTGFISSYAQAVAGPKIGGVGSGYDPLTYTPTMDGDYYVNFYRSSNSGASHNIAESMLAKYFDMTVVSSTGTTFTGRLHCNEWAFSVYDPSNSDVQNPLSSTNAQFYTYTPDSVVAKVYFPSSGFEPLSYIVAFNSFGVINNGNWLNDRRSIVLQTLDTLHLRGGYPVFLNQPDTALYRTCVLPLAPQLVSPTISGCAPGPFNIRFKAPQAGDYYMLLDLNGVTGYQANSADRWIELVSQSPGVITYVWDGKNGLGVSVPANTTFPITFSFRKGRINIPFYDVEMNINGFSVDGVAPQNSLLRTLYWCDTLLYSVTNASSSNNNNTTGVGYDNSVTGQVSPGHAWNGNGNPAFAIPAPAVSNNNTNSIQTDDFGNARLINTWAWGVTLDTTQIVQLICLTVSGTVYDDADNSAAGTNSNIQTNSETGTNAGGTLYASLVDPVSGLVISTTTVASNGTYTLTNCPANATGMYVVISTTAATVGSAAPSTGIPSNWVNTSPLTNTFNTVTSNITGINFGIEQLPNSNDQHYTIGMPTLNSSLTLNGYSTVASPGPLAGSDPEDGTMGSGKKVVITQVPTNEELYYSGSKLSDGAVITNYNPALLAVKFTNVTVFSTYFKYAFVDAAGKQDPTPATYTIDMSVTLATTLGSFSAYGGEAGNILNWTVYNETNGVYYIAERSTDGINFESLGRIEGSGNGSGDMNGNVYVYTDAHPTANVVNYYRIRLTDHSGGSTYSNIVKLSASSGSSVVDVAPNPFRGALTVRLNLAGAGKVSLRLVDSKGTVLKRMEYEGGRGANTIQMTGMESLPVSVYFLQVVVSDQVIVKKVFNR